MNTENAILWLCAVALWLVVVCWILWGVQILRTIARFLGAWLARVFFNGRPR